MSDRIKAIIKTILIVIFIASLSFNLFSWYKFIRNDSKTYFKHYECEDPYEDKPDKEMQIDENEYYQNAEYYFMSMYSTPTDVVFAGDSITKRCEWGEFFEDLDVKNRGLTKDSTSGLLSRIDSIMATEPKKLFIMVGINDIRFDVDIDDCMDNMKNIIETVQEKSPETKIYIQSVLPVSDKWDDVSNDTNIIINEYNDKLQSLCESNSVTYIDIASLFKDEDGILAEKYNYDGLHLTAEAYEVWINTVSEYIYGDE